MACTVPSGADWRAPVVADDRGRVGIMAKADVAATIGEFHDAQAALARGEVEPIQAMLAEGEDVTVANPFGGIARGPAQVAKTLAAAAANFRDGKIVGVEVVSTVVTPELAYLVEVERFRARMGGRDELADLALRATTIFRREAGAWKLVHRHADPLVSPQAPASLRP